MDLEKYDKLCRKFSKEAIDGEMLMDIEKLSRYIGKDVYGENVSIQNMGVVQKKELHDKMNFDWKPDGGFDFSIDKTIQIPEYVKYDLSVINSSSVCSDYCSFLLVSKRPNKYDLQTKPRELHIYCVTMSGRGTKDLPSINQIKKDIRSGKYKEYNSLLYEFCGEYSLYRPTDKCDKMAVCYTLIGIIDQLTYYIPETFKMEVIDRKVKQDQI